MSVSATSSNVYVNYSSFFSQGGNKAFSAFQSAVTNYSDGAFQIRRTSALTLDILDLSPEGLAKAESLTPPATTEKSEAVNDVTLETPEISESERVEMIRVNKNAVLDRVQELLTEKGIDVSADQRFELTTNFLDGSISLAGIDDPELAAAFTEALAGDEELIARMKKTREELGLTEPANTVPRNFTIEFGSMLQTPPETELEYKIDMFVNPQVPLLEYSPDADESEQIENKKSQPELLPFYSSILLSNKPKLESDSNLLKLPENDKNVDKKEEKSNKTNESDEINESEESDESESGLLKSQTETPDFIPDEPEHVTELSESENSTFSFFGSYFRADSKINFNSEGLTLNWNLQFSNWDISGNTSSAESTQATQSTQRLFETLTIGGSTFYAADSTNPLGLGEQASQLYSQFIEGFSQGISSSWAKDFIAQNGLDSLGL